MENVFLISLYEVKLFDVKVSTFIENEVTLLVAPVTSFMFKGNSGSIE
jgi:hypothetical protein